MMREIKFRAWDSTKMRFVVEADMVHVALTGGISHCSYSGVSTRNDLTLSQYTGLKDSHNNDLYEDDICWNPHDETFGRVIWYEGAWCYEWADVIENLHDCVHMLDLRGNIYENPELLEQTNDQL